MSKKVYLIQSNAVYGEEEKSTYLPYALGTIAAYAWQFDEIRQNYDLGRFIHLREDIDSCIASLDEPYLIGFSAYVWNREYSFVFAKKIKEKYPSCIVVFGGHSVSPDEEDLKSFDFIDILIHGEGEKPFADLLKALASGSSLDTVDNISYRSDKGTPVSTHSAPPPDIAGFPSPFLEGYFDDIMSENGMSFSVIWETNRGCPNHCAYCDWGLLKSKIRQFPMERIEAEIKWIADHKIEYIYCADANFGIFDRDEKIMDLVIESKEKTGYPQKFKTNFTKNRDEVVLRLGKKMMDAGIGKSPTLSFQSLDPQVLKNIGRNNMDLEHFRSLINQYAGLGVPSYSELILGLPGETYDSFVNGLCTLLDCGQNKSIGIYPCELLPNSMLGSPEAIKKYGIVTRRMKFSQYHCKINSDDIAEYSDIIIETNSMRGADWERSYIFGLYIQGLHNIGLTRGIAIFLHYEFGITYRSFYEGLLKYFSEHKDTICGQDYIKAKDFTHGVTIGKNAFTSLFPKLGEITWGFEEYLFLHSAYNKEEFYNVIRPYVVSLCGNSDTIDELFAYQSMMIKQIGLRHMEKEFETDFYGYFRDIYLGRYHKPLKRRNKLTIDDPSPTEDYFNYARFNMWYGRRDDRPVYSSNPGMVKAIYQDRKQTVG